MHDGHERRVQDFIHDVKQRQKNIVYPDTLTNEISAWRRLYTSAKPWTPLQWIGIGTLLVVVSLCFVGFLSVFAWLLFKASGPFWFRVVNVTLSFAVVLIPLGLFFYVMTRKLKQKA